MEVSDPYSNTTTVKNILQHIIVPKIVNDGSNGYVTRTDLVNIDNIIFRGVSSGLATEARPHTSQGGSFLTGTKETTVNHSRVRPTSVIMACTHSEQPALDVAYVFPQNGSFKVALANTPSVLGVTARIGWFIVHF
jgi:hypothetical protein